MLPSEKSRLLLECIRDASQYVTHVLTDEGLVKERAPATRIAGLGMLGRANEAALSVALLTEHGRAFDATATGRLLTEIAIVSQWIMRGDSEDRARRFVRSGAFKTEHLLEILAKAHDFRVEREDEASHAEYVDTIRDEYSIAPGKPLAIPSLLEMAREDPSVLAAYNFAFSDASRYTHCDPRTVYYIATGEGQPHEQVLRIALWSAVMAMRFLIEACAHLLGRTDGIEVVRRAEELARETAG